MGSTPGPQGLKKLYVDIISQNVRVVSTTPNHTENESGMIRISAHPEAEKPEEQHHKTPQAHVKFLLELLWLLFDFWGLGT